MIAFGMNTLKSVKKGGKIKIKKKFYVYLNNILNSLLVLKKRSILLHIIFRFC